MRTHRFGRKIKLPSTIVIKHQLRKLMFEDLVKEGEDAALQCSDVSGFEGKPEVAGTDSSRRACPPTRTSRTTCQPIVQSKNSHVENGQFLTDLSGQCRA